MKRYHLEIETKNLDMGNYTFEAISDRKAKRNAKRLAGRRRILALYVEEDGKIVELKDF